ncbi:MAG: helix-turn-helix transcriptional regulator [Chloroflexales bacterium]|nr:helix-turn-helix transcriptional regulator [Chloroflexales bacterium]
MTAATTDAATEAAELFKALAHPTRVAILEVLRHGEECVCHMEAVLGKRQAYISQQLMILRAAGIVLDRRDGLNMFYRVVRPEVFAVLDAARGLASEPGSGTIPLRPADCPCPNCHPATR